jgi:exopolysaccharide biosynthesis polyprenyl glycosylphosphotransferase
VWFDARRMRSADTNGDDAAGRTNGLEAVEERDRRYRRALAAADAVAVLLMLALTTRLEHPPPTLVTIAAVPLVIFTAKLHGLYDRDELLIYKTTIDDAPKLFQIATLCTLVFWLLGTATGHTSPAAGPIVLFWVSLLAFTLLGRWLARTLVRRAVATERCLFVGTEGAYARLEAKFETTGVHALLVGRMWPTSEADGSQSPSAHEQELAEFLKETQAHRVIMDPQVLPPEDMLEFVRATQGMGVRLSLLPRVLDVIGSEVVFDRLHGVTLLGVHRFGLSRSSRFVKRSLDLVGSTLVLLLATPFMAAIALAIKLDSRGPVFFRQRRVGRNGEPFQIVKFRTMVADAEARKAALRAHNQVHGGLFKIVDDPRITRVGRLLRRTSLDELPQLFNVFSGHMSLVGPRPLVLDEDAHITGADRVRLDLKPGMTGPWQVAGSARVPLAEMVKLDCLYVGTWSLWEDIRILVSTLLFVIHRRGM